MSISSSNLEKSVYFQRMSICPKTVQDIKMLVYFMDKFHLFKSYNLANVLKMSPRKLDIFYLLLVYINKSFYYSCNNITKRVFAMQIKKIIPQLNEVGVEGELLRDQFIQDFGFLVTQLISKYYPSFDHKKLNDEITTYVQSTFHHSFYVDNFKDVVYNIQTKYKQIADQVTQEFISITHQILDEDIKFMKNIIMMLFHPDDKYCHEMEVLVYENMNPNDAYDECNDLLMYYEEKCQEMVLETDNKNDEIPVLHLYTTKSPKQLLQVFVENNFIKNKMDGINILYHFMKNYGHITINQKNMTVKDLYNFYSNTNKTYKEACQYLLENTKIPSFLPINFILEILGKIFDIKINLVDKEHKETFNSESFSHEMTIYKQNNTFGILTSAKFEPILSEAKSVPSIFLDFCGRMNIISHHEILNESLLEEITYPEKPNSEEQSFIKPMHTCHNKECVVSSSV
jgi:hypothetical protein